MVALSGTSWPDTLRRLQEKWQDIEASATSAFTSLSSFISPSPAQRLAEAPQAEPAGSDLRVGGEGNTGDTTALIASRTAIPRHFPSASVNELAALGTASDPANTAVVPATYQAASTEDPANRAATAATLANRAYAPDARSGTTAGLPPGQSAVAADPFAHIQNRLRRLGATYYLLEAWGDEQPLYRFYCKMAMGGNTSYTRYFEATDADPLQAMSQVLREVEAWHNGASGKAESAKPPAAR